MQSRTGSSTTTTTILVVLLVIFTFPIWIGIAGGIFGLIAGIFGAVIGVVAGIFGAIFGVIGGIFGWIFDFDLDCPFHFGGSKFFVIAAIVLAIVLVARSRRI